MPDDTPLERAPKAWIAPLISTLVTLPACMLAYLGGGFSGMACDSCEGAESDAFESSYGKAFPVLMVGLCAALVLLFVSWALPWQVRNQGRRVMFAVGAPLLVALAYAVFSGLVNWPSV